MHLEIVSPEATLFSGEVDSIIVPGINGAFEMLQNHAPIVSLLKSGNIKITGNIKLEKNIASKFKKSENSFLLPINSGTLELKNNSIIVLAD